MSAPIADSLRELLTVEKHNYLDQRRESGGTAKGFRERISRQYAKDPKKFEVLALEAVMEAVTRNWEQQPRTRGPDLFSINTQAIPEYLTRPALGHVDGDDIGDEERFEKVLAIHATVNDLRDDALIKLRKAAQSSAAAERRMAAADEARRRAKGDMSVFLRDIADKKK